MIVAGERMIVFYAWTNLQIINYINLKTNYYPESEACLITLKLERISDDLLSEVKTSNIFLKVIELQKPKQYLERKRRGIAEYCQGIFSGIYIRRCITDQLRADMPDGICTRFVTAAFWSEAMYVYQYLRNNNKQLPIILVEEGLSCYSAPKNWLFKTAPSLSVKSMIRSYLYYGIIPKIAVKHTSDIYMYLPEISSCNEKLRRHRLPMISEKNQPCYSIVKSMAMYGNDEYKKRRIIFVADAPRTNLKEPYRYVYKALDALLSDDKEIIDNIIIKMHPTSGSLSCRFEYGKYDIMVDYRGDALEFITYDMTLQDKIIIANNSMAVYNVIGSMGKKPYIIFMHRICDIEDANENKRNDALAQKLKNIYDYPEHIGVPNNSEELRRILHSFIHEIENEDININKKQKRG